MNYVVWSADFFLPSGDYFVIVMSLLYCLKLYARFVYALESQNVHRYSDDM